MMERRYGGCEAWMAFIVPPPPPALVWGDMKISPAGVGLEDVVGRRLGRADTLGVVLAALVDGGAPSLFGRGGG